METPFEAGAAVQETMARSFHEQQLSSVEVELVAMIHPQAEMELLASGGRRVAGRLAIIRSLEHGRQAAIFQARVTRCERLDAHTLLVHGRARYTLEGRGFAEGAVWWLDEFRDGLLWRVRPFTSRSAARAAYRELVAGRSVLSADSDEA